MYLRIDGGIKEGNIRYKDKNDVKYVLPLKVERPLLWMVMYHINHRIHMVLEKEI
jgi:hypothetical protein